MWANASARLSKGCGRSAVHSPACPQPAPTEARDAGLQLERPTALATGMKTVRLEGELGCSIAPMKLGPKYTSQRRAGHLSSPAGLWPGGPLLPTRHSAHRSLPRRSSLEVAKS